MYLYVYKGMKGLILALLSLACWVSLFAQQSTNQKQFEVVKTDAVWKQQLSADAYNVLRKKGTERAFTGALLDNHENGIYYCAGCGNELFSSAHKFESGTGWPSFYKPITKGKVIGIVDNSYGMVRTEAVCARCGGHLGHVFDDGPNPTGLRYCMNSASMTFKKK
jgi:peptide-methionine (R)-S-oxide reductase